MSKVSEYTQALKQFAKDVGAPEVLIADPRPVHKSKYVKAFYNQVGTTLKILEEYTQWASRDELYIGLMKEATRKDTRAQHSPPVLWEYCAKRRAMIFCLTACNLFQLQGQLLTQQRLGRKEISQTCANLIGMSGCISGMEVLSTHFPS